MTKSELKEAKKKEPGLYSLCKKVLKPGYIEQIKRKAGINGKAN